MATRGTFTPELLPEGWFDETLRPEGWFSQDFLEPITSGDAALTGTSSLTFSAIGSLVTGAYASGATTLTFTTAATLLGNAALTGTSTLAFAATGNLSGNAPLTGASTLTFATSGTLNGAALMGGASFPTFNVSGALQTGANLSGATNLVFSVSGILEGQEVGQPEVIVIDGGAGTKRKAHEAKRKAWEDDLRRIVEAAFSDAPQIDDTDDVTPEVRKEIVRTVRYQADLSGIDASASRIDRLIAEYLAILAKRHEEEEEEAAIMLLFAA